MRSGTFASTVAILLLFGCGDAAMEAAENAAFTNDTALDGGALAPDADLDEAARTRAVFCEEVSRRVAPEDCEYFRELAQRTEEGVGAFNAPREMERGDTFPIQLALAPAPPPTEGFEGDLETAANGDQAEPAEDDPTQTDANGEPHALRVGAAPPPPQPAEMVESLPGETIEIAPLVGRFMTVQLTGTGFRIEPSEPVRKEVPPQSTVTWQWQVTALEQGEQTLTLHTVVEGMTATGEPLPLRSTQFNHQVAVNVGTIGWWADLLDALPAWMKRIELVLVALGGLLTAAFGVYWIVKKRGRKEA